MEGKMREVLREVERQRSRNKEKRRGWWDEEC